MAARFNFIHEDYVDQRVKGRISAYSRKNTAWCVNTWNTWTNERNNARIYGQPKFPNARQMQFISPLELNEYLCYFLVEVRNKEGKMYSKDSLHNLVSGLARYLKKDLQRPDLNFMNPSNMYFNRFRQGLDTQMELATVEGIGGTVKRQVQPISQEQEQALWEKEILNCNTALGLSRAVYFYNCKVFGISSKDDHHNLMVEQYSFGTDDSGQFVKLTMGVCKNVTGGVVERRLQLKEVKQYDNAKEVCVYKVFKTYIEIIGDKGYFYRKPLPPRFSGDIRFAEKPVAKNILRTYIKNIMQEAGLTGFFTDYSGKVTLATTLFHQGVDEQLIQERTGQRSGSFGSDKRKLSLQPKEEGEMVDIPEGYKSGKRNKQFTIQETILPPKKRRTLPESAAKEKSLPDEEDELVHVMEDNIDQKVQGRIPANTRKNTSWCVNTWNTWTNERNNARILGQPKFPNARQLQFISPLELNEYLCYFVLEVRTKQGKMYPKDSLHNLVFGLSRYLKDELQRPDLNFMNPTNVYFNRFRQRLDSQMKQATEEGIGTVKRQAQPISQEQEQALWEKEILNCNTALGLSRAVYFYNCKVFGFRSKDDHHNLMVEQYSFGTDDSGQFVKFTTSTSKNVPVGLVQRRVQLKEVKEYDNAKEVCVYKVFKTYIEIIGDKGHFYRKPLPLLGDIQFSEQPVAQNILRNYITNMMQEAGFSGYFTGYSFKDTLATTKFHQKVDEQLIKERTLQRSDAVKSYKRKLSSQQKVISEIIDIPTGYKSVKKNKPFIVKETTLPPKKRRALQELDAKEQLPDEDDANETPQKDQGKN